ncbi:MAG: LamG-like jellyroll fold domain-containing protein, partial [Kiritimatiellia bacterium]|nr:LamG-like jellyroll fold domain-containing protein [Kiritimatiellia bacterium]
MNASSRRLSRDISRVLCASLLFMSGTGPLRAAIINAAGGSRAHIQAAVDQAQPGDVVQIPSGTFDVDGIVNLKEGIHIRGAGSSATRLKKQQANDDPIFRLSVTNGIPFQISGIAFEGRGVPLLRDNAQSAVIDTGIDIRGRATDFQIYDCLFTLFSGNGVYFWGTGGALTGHPSGVIRDCLFSDIFYTLAGVTSRGYGVCVMGDQSWPLKPAYGSSAAVFVENCEFIRIRHVIAANSGARYVFRYNMVEDSYAAAVDAHGWMASSPGFGTRSVEVYGNSISGGVSWPNNTPLANGMWAVGIRGGDGVIFDNDFSGMGEAIFLIPELWGNTAAMDVYAKVGHWKADEASGTAVLDYKVSPYNNGFLPNGATRIAGPFGNALQLDGSSQRMNVTNVPLTRTAGDFNTVAFWMRWDGPTASYWQMPFSWSTSYCLTIRTNGFGFNTGQGNIWGAALTPEITAGQWVHIAAVFPNNQDIRDRAKLYIDGIEQSLSERFPGNPSTNLRTATTNA